VGLRNARGTNPADLSLVPSPRLPRARRREDLLDAAVELIISDGVEAVSMESVADRAGVSRPLVYKHFANRTDMLVDLYRREARLMQTDLTAAVRAEATLEGMYRALVRAALEASSRRRDLFTALRSAGAWNRELRREHRARDRQTIQFFADLACKEFGVPAAEAEAITMMLLTAMESVLGQWQARRTPANAVLLEETYIDVVIGALERTADRTSGNDEQEVADGPGRG
jgi:AcrR family transcriptional regulator